MTYVAAALYGGAFGALIGIPIGMWARDKYWIAAARAGVRAESGGKLYNVFEDRP